MRSFGEGVAQKLFGQQSQSEPGDGSERGHLPGAGCPGQGVWCAAAEV